MLNDEFTQAIDEEIDDAIAKVRQGTHAELEKRAEALHRAKENKMAAADRHRKMQIKNINLLYEYELEDAGALYNVTSFVLSMLGLFSYRFNGLLAF